jgi:hypothetical protein
LLGILGLIVAGGALAELTRRRGGSPWATVPVAIVGYFAVRVIAVRLLGSGPDLLAAVAWFAFCFGAVFLIFGGGRRSRSSWQCPECQFFNTPSTLVCPCGYRLDAG